MPKFYGLPMKIHPPINDMLNKLLNFNIDSHKRLYSIYLSQNPNAVSNLENEPNIVNWEYIGLNPSAIHLIHKEYITNSLSELKWWYITANPSAISLLLKYPNKIINSSLYLNPNAISIIEYHIENNPNIVNWFYLSRNPSAINILKKNLNKIKWDCFSINPSPEAVEMLLLNQDKIDWNMFSLNTSPRAIYFLEHNPEKINWDSLSQNPSAISLLKQNPEKVSYTVLLNTADIKFTENNIQLFSTTLDVEILFSVYSNPSIFVYDYEQMKKNMDILREDLIKEALHPRRVKNWIDNGNEDMLE